MDSESAPAGRRVDFPGAPQLVSAANCAAHLPIHAYMSGSHSYFVVRHGQGASANDADQAAHSLSHVLVLRALREAAQLHARSRARVSRKNWRNIGRNAPDRSERAPERSAAPLELFCRSSSGLDAARPALWFLALGLGVLLSILLS